MVKLLTVTKDANLAEDYSYDICGTRISETTTFMGLAERTFSYSDEDHLLSAGLATYPYDLDGFLTTETETRDLYLVEKKLYWWSSWRSNRKLSLSHYRRKGGRFGWIYV
jgi:hypothetical protein